ncbi:transglutaminase TgpA family protein [Aurantivibrio plasticivorans]
MTPYFQLSRASFVWLLVSQLLLIVPHLGRLPIWVIAAWSVAVVWRVQIYRGIWGFPKPWVKATLLLVCVIGLGASFRKFYGLEPMIALLITMFILKLLEMSSKRDALLIIYLGYFVVATELLFYQSMLATIYVFFCVILLTTTLLSLYQSAHTRPAISFRYAATMVFQSVPLMFVLFITMPRVGSIWAVPQPTNTAKTGVSDSMAPGDFSNLAQSNATAFKVKFENEVIPLNSDLYWRGLVFSDFDGRRWELGGISSYPVPTRQSASATRAEPLLQADGRPIRYNVIMEPTQQHWLYAIPTARSNEEAVRVTGDNRLVRRKPIGTRISYSVESYLNFAFQMDSLPSHIRRRNTYLPDGFNAESIATAHQWLNEVGNDERAYMQKVLNYFRSDFVYTLSPPLLGRHSVDEFMWKTRRGFCEHFASSFTVMMRAAGIPARVVAGYQGGKWNPLENFLRVSQAEAHAWSEVWFEGEGWVRVDPTAWVAPNRIESGIDAALSVDEVPLLTGTLSLERFSHLSFINNLKLRLEAIEYQWQSTVMGYNQEQQTAFLRRLLGDITPMRIALLLIGSGAVILAAIGVSLLISMRQQRMTLADKYYHKFLKRLSTLGIERGKGEPPRTFARRSMSALPDQADWIEQVSTAYETYTYQNDAAQLEVLRSLVNR